MSSLKHRQYSYRAVNQTGCIVKGSALASCSKALYSQLQQQQLSLLSHFPIPSWHSPSFLSKKIKAQDLIDFCLHMQYMDQAGVPLLETLQDAKTSIPALASVLDDFILKIRGGALLSQAIAEHKEIFPPLFCRIISLSETSGNLSEGFCKLYDHLIWIDQNKKQLSKSIRYPLLVFTLLCVVVWLMLSQVMPGMKDLALISGTDLSPASRWLIDFSSHLCQAAPLLLGSSGVLTVLLISARWLSDRQRLWQDQMLLKLPYLGRLWQKRDLSLYLHFFHVSSSAGIDILDSLDYSLQSLSNSWLQAKLRSMHAKIRDGLSFAAAFQQPSLFDPTALRLIQLGETTGQLVPLLALLDRFHTQDLKRQIEQVLAYLQPFLLGIVGLILIWIVLGIFYPMYDQLIILEEGM